MTDNKTMIINLDKKSIVPILSCMPNNEDTVITIKGGNLEIYSMRNPLLAFAFFKVENCTDIIFSIKCDSILKQIKSFDKDIKLEINKSMINLACGDKKFMNNQLVTDTVKQYPKLISDKPILFSAKEFIQTLDQCELVADSVRFTREGEQLIIFGYDSKTEIDKFRFRTKVKQVEDVNSKFSIKNLKSLIDINFYEFKIYVGVDIPIKISGRSGDIEYTSVLAPLVKND